MELVFSQFQAHEGASRWSAVEMNHWFSASNATHQPLELPDLRSPTGETVIYPLTLMQVAGFILVRIKSFEVS